MFKRCTGSMYGSIFRYIFDIFLGGLNGSWVILGG